MSGWVSAARAGSSSPRCNAYSITVTGIITCRVACVEIVSDLADSHLCYSVVQIEKKIYAK